MLITFLKASLIGKCVSINIWYINCFFFQGRIWILPFYIIKKFHCATTDGEYVL